jgi:hypothetical protein
MHTKFWLEGRKGRYYSEDVVVDEKIILEGILLKYGGKMWTGFMWVMIRTSGVYM